MVIETRVGACGLESKREKTLMKFFVPETGCLTKTIKSFFKKKNFSRYAIARWHVHILRDVKVRMKKSSCNIKLLKNPVILERDLK
jgi:hypothetical protein